MNPQSTRGPDPMWANLIDELRGLGIAFETGLTDPEVAAAEDRYGFRFPPDLQAFLQAGLPSGDRFPDWRAGAEAQIRQWLDLPREGVLFDVEHNGFWLNEWGPRSSSLAAARQVVDALIAAAPRLIPVYGHRMMPAEPHQAGNPVFSVHQTDIIIYGADLTDYLTREFLAKEDAEVESIPDDYRRIPFWDIERFQAVRWGPDGSCVFDNSRGLLP